MSSDMVMCPFNKAHLVSRLRLPYHLAKCKKSYPITKKIICPYDATEYIEPENFQEHLRKCSLKVNFDIYKGVIDDKNSKSHGDCRARTYEVDPSLVSTDWDCEDSDRESSSEDEYLNDRINNTLAIKKSLSYIPPVKVMGRGVRFLQTCNKLSKVESFNKLESSNEIEGIYEDANDSSVSNENSNNSTVENQNLDINGVNNLVTLQNNIPSEAAPKTSTQIETFRKIMVGRGINKTIIGRWSESKNMGRGKFFERNRLPQTESACVENVASKGQLNENTCSDEKHSSEQQLGKRNCSENKTSEKYSSETHCIEKKTSEEHVIKMNCVEKQSTEQQPNKINGIENNISEPHPSKTNCVEKDSTKEQPSKNSLGQEKYPNITTPDSADDSRLSKYCDNIAFSSHSNDNLKIFNVIDEEAQNAFGKYKRMI